MHLQFFIDFDDTIATADVGNAFFFAFGGLVDDFKQVETSWLNGDISSTELYNIVCKTVRLTQERFDEFLARQNIDPSFLQLLEYVRSHGDKLMVMSDGFANYIRPILARFGVADIEICANEFIFDRESGKITPVFPYEQHSCGRCANCKGYQVRQRRLPAMQTVFVGDGMSDRCGAGECDYIFAKMDLAEYCQQNRIDYFPFRDFHDVIEGIETIRHRH